MATVAITSPHTTPVTVNPIPTTASSTSTPPITIPQPSTTPKNIKINNSVQQQLEEWLSLILGDTNKAVFGEFRNETDDIFSSLKVIITNMINSLKVIKDLIDFYQTPITEIDLTSFKKDIGTEIVITRNLQDEIIKCYPIISKSFGKTLDEKIQQDFENQKGLSEFALSFGFAGFVDIGGTVDIISTAMLAKIKSNYYNAKYELCKALTQAVINLCQNIIDSFTSNIISPSIRFASSKTTIDNYDLKVGEYKNAIDNFIENTFVDCETIILKSQVNSISPTTGSTITNNKKSKKKCNIM